MEEGKILTEKLEELDGLIESVEQDCEWPKVNILLQRLLDLKFEIEEVFKREGL